MSEDQPKQIMEVNTPRTRWTFDIHASNLFSIVKGLLYSTIGIMVLAAFLRVFGIDLLSIFGLFFKMIGIDNIFKPILDLFSELSLFTTALTTVVVTILVYWILPRSKCINALLVTDESEPKLVAMFSFPITAIHQGVAYSGKRAIKYKLDEYLEPTVISYNGSGEPTYLVENVSKTETEIVLHLTEYYLMSAYERMRMKKFVKRYKKRFKKVLLENISLREFSYEENLAVASKLLIRSKEKKKPAYKHEVVKLDDEEVKQEVVMNVESDRS